MTRHTTHDTHPPGTISHEFDQLAATIDQLPFWLRWFWQRRLQQARKNYERYRDESLAEWFRRHW